MDEKNCYKYIVPFKLKFDNFNELCKKIDSFEDTAQYTFLESKENSRFKGLWESMTDAGSNEHDIYDSVRDSFFAKREGNTWKYKLWNTVKNKECISNILEFYYRSSDNNYLKLSVKSVYLTICRTGIGFIYYTIMLPENMSEHDFINFQNLFKELNGLNRKDSDYLWMIETNKAFSIDGFDTPVNIVYPYDNEKKEAKDKERNVWYVPFSMGNWLACRLNFLGVEYFAGRVNDYHTKINKYFGYSNLKGDELHKAIVAKTGLPEIVPDKAIIFNGLLIKKNTLNDVERFVYNVTNGYTDKYDISDNSRQEMIYPFKNVIFYATNYGAGYYAVVDEKSREIFTNTVQNKINDYFLLYLDVLYQSYSIINFSHELSGSDFSYEHSDYISDNHDVGQNLSNIRARINLFLVKSMTASVSYIHHQNMFYSYLEKVLNIKDDAEHLIYGLDALDNLHKQQQENSQKKSDRELQFTLSGVALLAGFSALSDSQTFFKDFCDNLGCSDTCGFYWWIAFGILIFCISLGMYINLFKPFCYTVWNKVKK